MVFTNIECFLEQEFISMIVERRRKLRGGWRLERVDLEDDIKWQYILYLEGTSETESSEFILFMVSEE